MTPEGWLQASLVLPGVVATQLEDLVDHAANALGAASGVEPGRVRDAFLGVMRGESFSIGSGVAIPHIDMVEVRDTVVCLVTLKKPLRAATIDGQALDIFFFILSKPDPQGHLLLLAHLARLTQSRTLLEGLRRAQTAEEVVALVRAGELRHIGFRRVEALLAAHTMILVSVSGEKAMDALLIDLIDQGYGDSCVLEAQSLREAAAREVPLFSGFRDLFGDPGGRRVLLVEAPADHVEEVLDTVKRICEAKEARDAAVSVLPIQTRWTFEPAANEETAGKQGH